MEKKKLGPLPEQGVFEQYKFNYDTLKAYPQTVYAFDSEKPARQQEILGRLIGLAANTVDFSIDEYFKPLEAALLPMLSNNVL